MTPGSLAISELMRQTKKSRRRAAKDHLSSYSAFSSWKTSRRGPNVATLDRLLTGLGLTGKDWARAFEKAKLAVPIPRPKERRAPEPWPSREQSPCGLSNDLGIFDALPCYVLSYRSWK